MFNVFLSVLLGLWAIALKMGTNGKQMKGSEQSRR